MKNPNDEKDENPFRYIILYNEIRENLGNEINFFLYIIDKKERNEAVDYILKNNLSNYFKKIDYNYKEEFKKISNNYYIVRCCNASLVENFITKIEQNKSNVCSINVDLKTKNNELNIKKNQNTNLEENLYYNNIQGINNFNQNNFQNIKMSMNIMNNMNMDFNNMNFNLLNNNNGQNLFVENSYKK